MPILRSVAIDLGAGSCRVSLGEWNGNKASVKVIHRFPNGPVERDGHLYWALDQICRGAQDGLRRCAELMPEGDGSIHSVGVDGWAVDYVRLDAAGKPLGDPFCYRDLRTETCMPEVWSRIARERVYELTGIQFLRFNTLYQLFADVRDGVAASKSWLNIPEYLLYHLGGSKPGSGVSEFTNATHTQLVDVRKRDWCDEIFDQAGLNRSAAPTIVPPGTRLGLISAPLASLRAFKSAQLIAPACHDTGAAVASIPDANTDWAFISSGTWSLVGAVLESPCTSAAALRENFTNEGGVGGRIRFLKNVNGMWLLEECIREWKEAGGYSASLPELIAECEKRPASGAVFNVDATELIQPGNMPSKINHQLERAGFAPVAEDASGAPAMAHIIFASLAARYAEVLRALQEVTGRKFRRLYVVGGGSQNHYLNRLIAERTGLAVMRGAVEGSTFGNLAIQFAALEGGGEDVSPNAVAQWAERLACDSSA